MHSKIFWFSGTGSSYWVAKQLHQEMDGSELHSIRSFDTSQTLSADAIGVVFPVYAWGPPKAVARFLRELRANQDTYFFIVLTYAEDCGSTAIKVNNLLKKSGIALAASYSVQMPNNYPPLYKKKTEKEATTRIKNAPDKVKEISRQIKGKARGNFEFFTTSKIIAGTLFYSLFLASFNQLDKQFSCLNDICTRCGVCEKICPSHNIKIKDNEITWNHHCEQCFACFHWCPQKAIQFGKKTLSQPRYHYPEVSLKELL